jgi:hypothetical protein
MSFTPSISSDADLLWHKDKYDVYFKLFVFSGSPQVHVEANHIDDVANANLLMMQLL